MSLRLYRVKDEFDSLFYKHEVVIVAIYFHTEENTVDLSLGVDKHPLHLGMRTLGAKSDSRSSKSSIADNQVTELEFLNSRNTKVQKDAFTDL